MRIRKKISRKTKQELSQNIWWFGLEMVFLLEIYRQTPNKGEYGNKNTANIGVLPS